ncbi:MAG: hypothetical protein ISN28_13150 [Ectothiorhodospiraceae bacterium AqS1]|nr:hypothetical protein [Ectothiorhodospiraceae bacterium AqS1]
MRIETKADIAEVKTDIAEVKTDIAGLKEDVRRIERKLDDFISSRAAGGRTLD